MSASVIGLIVTIIGFVTMLLKWAYNPKRILEVKIADCDKRWKDFQTEINAPLAKHDTDTLTRLNGELLEVLRQRKEAVDKLAQINGATVVKVFALFLLACGLSGCYKNVYFNESDKVICDNAGEGVCASTTYDCCVMGMGNFKSVTALNPTIKIIEVKDNTKESG